MFMPPPKVAMNHHESFAACCSGEPGGVSLWSSIAATCALEKTGAAFGHLELITFFSCFYHGVQVEGDVKGDVGCR